MKLGNKKTCHLEVLVHGIGRGKNIVVYDVFFFLVAFIDCGVEARLEISPLAKESATRFLAPFPFVFAPFKDKSSYSSMSRDIRVINVLHRLLSSIGVRLRMNQSNLEKKGASCQIQSSYLLTLVYHLRIDSPKEILFANVASNQIITILYQSMLCQSNEQESILIFTPTFTFGRSITIVDLELLLW